MRSAPAFFGAGAPKLAWVLGLHPALKALGLPKVGCTDSVGAATGDGNLPESIPPLSASRWDTPPLA